MSYSEPKESTDLNQMSIVENSYKYLTLSIVSFAFYLANILVGWGSIRYNFPLTPLDVVPEALMLGAGVVFGVIFILRQEQKKASN